MRYVFGRAEAVAIVLRRVAPIQLQRFIDWPSLRPLPTVDTNAALRTRAADLRFVVDLVDGRQRVPLLVPLEHQSTYDARLPCRVHVYAGDLWSRYLRAHPRASTVPAILPVALLQYPARNSPRRLGETLALTPRLRQALGAPISLEMVVDDLTGSVLDDPLAPPSTLALVEITRALLLAYRNPAGLTASRAKQLAPCFEQLLERSGPVGRDDIDALWRYVIQVFEPGSPLCTTIVESVGKGVREMYWTIADQLRAEGRAAGLTEGRAAGLSEALLEVLRRRDLSVSAPLRARVLSTRDEGLLQQWVGRALTVASAAELFDLDDE